jgi:CHAT domain-containing protein
LLYYMLDNDQAVVVSRGAQKHDQVVKVLEATAEQAEVLGIAAGPLNGEILEQVLQGKAGVLPHLANPDTNKQAEARLAVLWEVLVPTEIREALLQREYEGLVIVPDGVLGLLPFETLIVDAGADPNYLLDVAPPIIYAPSLTLLHTLALRSAPPHGNAEPSVLTIGDPLYGGTEDSSSQARSAGLRTRYGALGGKLARLPNTLSESHWVQRALKPGGWSAVQLLGSQATEAGVRSKIEGRAIVHLACHGLADQAYGNFFGALALTPGPRGNSVSSNDGFLTLAEVCELDLRGNELTMLSACQTNYGPQQQGEGVWALTRGFLVAGSRRVMASNWVVDDEAAATLVYYYALNIAEGQQSGQLDYARALHKAKQAVRQQAKWQSPFYWGPFVLVGPN